MAHEVETMAFAHKLPWHGLGERVDGNLTPKEMLKAAGLNWKVEQQDAFIEIGGEKVEIGRKALVRSSDKRILTVTGKDWKPLQNADAMEFFREYTEAGGATLETAGSLRGGKVIWGLAKLGKGFTMKGGDRTEGYILLTSPHEVGKAITVRTTAVRVVCANTLAMAERGLPAYRQNHLTEFDMDAARETVEISNQQIASLGMEAKALQQLKMSEYDTVRVLAKFFQPTEDKKVERSAAEIKALMNTPQEQRKTLQEVLVSVNKGAGATPENAWGVLNGVTHWADHVAGREADARMYRSWFGHTGKLKQDVKQELLEMAS